MTGHVMAFVAMYGNGGKVLDVGSFDVNGNVRNFYSDYTGLDRRPGRNVDIVADSHDIPFEDETFDKVLCLEMIEHDIFFWQTFREMARVLKKGGKLIVTTRFINFIKHDHPCDYYRFTQEALIGLFEMVGMKEVFASDHTGDNGVFAAGVKV